jgi:hypothetical protein
MMARKNFHNLVMQEASARSHFSVTLFSGAPAESSQVWQIKNLN